MKLIALTTEDGKFKIVNPLVQVGEGLTDLTTPSMMTMRNSEGEEFEKEMMWVRTNTSLISFACPTELINMEK